MKIHYSTPMTCFKASRYSGAEDMAESGGFRPENAALLKLIT
jgi:hypothetical protein